jgi:hypothetical protein
MTTGDFNVLDIDWGLDTGQDKTHMINVFTDLQRMVTSNVSSATITVIEKRNGPGHGFCFVEVRLLEAMTTRSSRIQLCSICLNSKFT